MNLARSLARKPVAKSFPVQGGTVHVRAGYFHVRGTVRLGDRTKRVRFSLDLEALRENKEAARAKAEQILRDAGLLLAGAPPRSFAENAWDFLQRPRKNNRPLGATDVAIIQELTARFGTRLMRDIPPAEFVVFVDERNRGNTAETRERYLNPVVAFLNVAVAAGQYPSMPNFVRDQEARNPSTRKTRPVERVGQNLVRAIFVCSHLANCTQYAVEEVTGARVSSVLFGCSLADLDLAAGKMTVTFRRTKAGFDVPAALPESLRPLLEEYLKWRQQQVRTGKVGPGSDEPLFLAPSGRPYKPNPAYTGTRNKTAWNAAKRRARAVIQHGYDSAITARALEGDTGAVDTLRRQRADDLALLEKITQHWWRHLLATNLGRLDPKAAMRQGGWRDPRSLSGYMMADAEFQRALVEQRGTTASHRPAWHKSGTEGDGE